MGENEKRYSVREAWYVMKVKEEGWWNESNLVGAITLCVD